jgi:hypothetical protein
MARWWHRYFYMVDLEMLERRHPDHRLQILKQVDTYYDPKIHASFQRPYHEIYCMTCRSVAITVAPNRKVRGMPALMETNHG